MTGLLERYYREQGYLSAAIDAPRYDFTGTLARVVLPVHEGPLFTARQVTATGNTVYTSTEIVAKLPVVSGAPFLSAAAEHSLERIRDLYWRKGYNDMRSEYALVVDRDAASVDVTFTIVEGPQSVVSEIAVEGNRRTSERLIRNQIELAPLQPLDLAILARSRRNLYSTGAFSIADITREGVDRDDSAVSGDAAVDVQSPPSDNQKPVRLTVAVREVQPVQLQYGLSYDTEGGLGGILDFSVRNMLGNARVFGAQVRYDSEIHEARFMPVSPRCGHGREKPPRASISAKTSIRQQSKPIRSTSAVRAGRFSRRCNSGRSTCGATDIAMNSRRRSSRRSASV